MYPESDNSHLLLWSSVQGGKAMTTHTKNIDSLIFLSLEYSRMIDMDSQTRVAFERLTGLSRTQKPEVQGKQQRMMGKHSASNRGAHSRRDRPPQDPPTSGPRSLAVHLPAFRTSKQKA